MADHQMTGKTRCGFPGHTSGTKGNGTANKAPAIGRTEEPPSQSS